MRVCFCTSESVLSSYRSAEKRGLRAHISARIHWGFLIDLFREDGGCVSTIETPHVRQDVGDGECFLILDRLALQVYARMLTVEG